MISFEYGRFLEDIHSHFIMCIIIEKDGEAKADKLIHCVNLDINISISNERSDSKKNKGDRNHYY